MQFMNFKGSLIFFLSNEEKEFFIIHSLEKLKLLHSGTYVSTSAPHVTLKSPLLLQFCNNKIKEMITNPRNSWLFDKFSLSAP